MSSSDHLVQVSSTTCLMLTGTAIWFLFFLPVTCSSLYNKPSSNLSVSHCAQYVFRLAPSALMSAHLGLTFCCFQAITFDNTGSSSCACLILSFDKGPFPVHRGLRWLDHRLRGHLLSLSLGGRPGGHFAYPFRTTCVLSTTLSARPPRQRVCIVVLESSPMLDF